MANTTEQNSLKTEVPLHYSQQIDLTDKKTREQAQRLKNLDSNFDPNKISKNEFSRALGKWNLKSNIGINQFDALMQLQAAAFKDQKLNHSKWDKALAFLQNNEEMMGKAFDDKGNFTHAGLAFMANNAFNDRPGRKLQFDMNKDLSSDIKAIEKFRKSSESDYMNRQYERSQSINNDAYKNSLIDENAIAKKKALLDSENAEDINNAFRSVEYRTYGVGDKIGDVPIDMGRYDSFISKETTKNLIDSNKQLKRERRKLEDLENNKYAKLKRTNNRESLVFRNAEDLQNLMNKTGLKNWKDIDSKNIFKAIQQASEENVDIGETSAFKDLTNNEREALRIMREDNTNKVWDSASETNVKKQLTKNVQKLTQERDKIKEAAKKEWDKNAAESTEKIVNEKSASDEKLKKSQEANIQATVSKELGIEETGAFMEDLKRFNQLTEEAYNRKDIFKEGYKINTTTDFNAKEAKEYKELEKKINAQIGKLSKDAQSEIKTSQEYIDEVAQRSVTINRTREAIKKEQSKTASDTKATANLNTTTDSTSQTKTEATKNDTTKPAEEAVKYRYGGNVGTKEGQQAKEAITKQTESRSETSSVTQSLTGEVTVNLVIDSAVVQKIVAKINSKK